MIAPASAVKVGGWPAAHVRVSYTLKAAGGITAPVLSRLWLVPRGSVMFLIGMSGTTSGEDLCEDEFAAALASIDIAP